jgi:hypothetical protein
MLKFKVTAAFDADGNSLGYAVHHAGEQGQTNAYRELSERIPEIIEDFATQSLEAFLDDPAMVIVDVNSEVA